MARGHPTGPDRSASDRARSVDRSCSAVHIDPSVRRARSSGYEARDDRAIARSNALSIGVLLALAIGSPAGCRTGGGGVEEGDLVAEPDLLDLGAVTVSLAGRGTLVLKNVGKSALTITSARPSSDLAPELRLEGVPAALAPGAKTAVSVVLTPAVRGSRDGRIVFSTSSARTPAVAVRVVAVANDPRLSAVPEALDFGRVVIGRAATASVTIRNTSDLSITVGTVSIDVATSNEFRTGIGGIQKLDPGAAFTFAISFTPRTIGLRDGRVVVGDDTRAPSRLGISLRGEGVASELEIDPRSLAFNALLIGETAVQHFRLHNLDTARHTVTALVLTSTAPDGFSISAPALDQLPLGLEPGQARNVDITFSPRRAGRVTTRVRIESSATAAGAFVDLSGDATLAAFGDIEVAPSSIEFGTAQVGFGATRTLRISNLGAGELHLTRPIEIEPSPSPYRWVSAIPDEGTFSPHETRYGRIRFLPTAIGPAPPSGLVIRSDDPRRPVIRLPIAGEGIAAPIADLELAPDPIEFGRVQRGVAASRSVILRNIGSAPLTIERALLTQDAGGRFRPEVLPMFPRTIAPSALLKIQLGYVDPLGLTARNAGALRVVSDDPHGALRDLPLVAETVPPEAGAPHFTIELRWDTGQTDLDLHLIRPAGAFFSASSDCCFCNGNPQWGPAAQPNARPFLDRDAIDGFGPETIRMQTAPPGSYQIAVHYFSDHGGGPTVARVAIRGGPDDFGAFSRLLSVDQRWDVGVVAWNGTRGSFTPSTVPLSRPSVAYCY